MFNKAVLSTYNFRSPIFMTLIHLTTSLFFTVMLKRLGYIDYPPFHWKFVKKMLPLSICFVSNVVLGLWSTKVVSVPVMTTLRRLTALFIIALEFVVLGVAPKWRNSVPVMIMLLGAFVTGYGDLYFDVRGYGVVLFNDIATATFLVLVKKSRG
eukprot:UN30592